MAKKPKTARQLRGQLMLQTSAGRFFRPGVELHETPHRRTVYSNAWIPDREEVELPIGTIMCSTEFEPISTATLEAVDRLEKTRWDGTDDFVVATGGDELIDDLAYVMTIALNRTFSRNHDLVHRLVPPEGATGRREGAASLFPDLFAPRQIIKPDEIQDLRQFMNAILMLERDNFARVMRVIRTAVDATRRAVDDPTGAYTDLVAALESLADSDLAKPTNWQNYDSGKRKIYDAALVGEPVKLVEKMRAAVLEADHAGLARRFVSSTLARITMDYYRSEAVGSVRPPQSADMQSMLEIAYKIRSRRSHVLEDLGEEAWVFTGGAEVAFEPTFDRVLTLAGVWRLLRHVTRAYVASASKVDPEPWDYRDSLPGQIIARLAPQYWIGQEQGLNATTAEHRFNGVVEAIIGTYSGEDGFDLTSVVEKVEGLVPTMSEGNPKAALVGIYALWHDWADSAHFRPGAAEFIEAHRASLLLPTPAAFATGVLGKRGIPAWTPDQWAVLATDRRAARLAGKAVPLPAKVDALMQLEAADQLEAVGRHEEALTFAANAVEECPGHEDLIVWESRLQERDHDPEFSVVAFLLEVQPEGDDAQGPK